MMSRELSIARREMEQANIVLEDLLLAELEGASRGSVVDITQHLGSSRGALGSMQRAITSLQDDMEEHGFEDLPTLRTVDFDALYENLQSADMVSEASWGVVERIMSHDGFRGILDLFENDVSTLDSLTGALILAVARNEGAAKAGELNLVLEENRVGNFKLEFARLYTAWARFQQIFLTSSMLSTELWYRFNNHGTVVGYKESAKAA